MTIKTLRVQLLIGLTARTLRAARSKCKWPSIKATGRVAAWAAVAAAVAAVAEAEVVVSAVVAEAAIVMIIIAEVVAMIVVTVVAVEAIGGECEINL